MVSFCLLLPFLILVVHGERMSFCLWKIFVTQQVFVVVQYYSVPLENEHAAFMCVPKQNFKRV